LVINELNLLLLEEKVSSFCIQNSDPKANHLVNILRVKTGDLIDLAAKNGPKGKGLVHLASNGDIKLHIDWLPDHKPDYYPISLVVGMARPQTCRKILDQATSLGVDSFSFFDADKSEPSYRKSVLWSGEEWRRKIVEGVEQAFSSSVPECKLYPNLESALSDEKARDLGISKIALDNYEGEQALKSFTPCSTKRICLCIGPERGWSPRERKILEGYEFPLFHLGPRVLRVETAVVGSICMLASGYWPEAENSGV
jgi:16S rRNA (uracil1498-N3)-methyltransferase